MPFFSSYLPNHTTIRRCSFLSVSSHRYLENFSWDVAKYSQRRALPELATLILSGVGSVEDELKQLSINLTEATQKLAGLTRKKG